MQIKVIKKRKPSQIESIITTFKSKHGRLSSLSQKVSISKCSSLENMSDLVMWQNLKDGADLIEEIIFENSEVFDTLTPRRIELLEYLTQHEPTSIRQLSESLHRDYKNVYDDLSALAAYDLIELESKGRKKRPICSITTIETTFEN